MFPTHLSTRFVQFAPPSCSLGDPSKSARGGRLSTLLQLARPITISAILGLDIVIAGAHPLSGKRENDTEIDLGKNRFVISGREGLQSRLCLVDLKLSNGRGGSGGAVQAHPRVPAQADNVPSIYQHFCLV